MIKLLTKFKLNIKKSVTNFGNTLFSIVKYKLYLLINAIFKSLTPTKIHIITFSIS